MLLRREVEKDGIKGWEEGWVSLDDRYIDDGNLRAARGFLYSLEL